MAAKTGDKVQVNYTGKLEDGQVFDSSEGRAPLEFEVGAGMVIAGFENAVEGMAVGETAEVTIPPEQAYGEHDDTLVRELPRDAFGEAEIEQGQMLALQDDAGRQHQALVTRLDDNGMVLDFNHMLAGKTLVFDIELVAIS